jgi:hypothetical protein
VNQFIRHSFALLLFISPSVCLAQGETDNYDLRGKQAKTSYYPSGHKRMSLDYYPPSIVPGMPNTFAIKTILTTYDVVTYSPRVPVESVYLVNCSKGSMTKILEVATMTDFSDIDSNTASQLRGNNSNTAVKTRGLESKSVNDPDALWYVGELDAYEIVCGRRN